MRRPKNKTKTSVPSCLDFFGGGFQQFYLRNNVQGFIVHDAILHGKKVAIIRPGTEKEYLEIREKLSKMVNQKSIDDETEIES